MMSPRILAALLVVSLIAYATSEENPTMRIEARDVVPTLPKRFGKPVYDLRSSRISVDGFLLGRELFYDQILSRDSSTSCGSCHQHFAAFGHVDHTLSHGIDGRIGKRNVPAIQNEIWSSTFMWDGGVTHMDLQPIAPITDTSEMGETLDRVIKKLSASTKYRRMFRSAFRTETITTYHMLKALSQFIALMVSADARYDRMMEHRDVYTDQEQRGLLAFRARCAACHREPLFTDGSYRNNGIGMDTALRDVGRFAITADPADSLKFKVPSLRNVDRTYPYMHDGRFRTLRAVLDHYGRGTFFGRSPDPALKSTVGMKEHEKKDILAFLLTLTDSTFLHDRRFVDPNIR
ncbi:MAG: c-type cytochrome [Bacteroidetes bacterium]|nr:c-type cytochrome [Bacteroidota bacterium]